VGHAGHTQGRAPGAVVERSEESGGQGMASTSPRAAQRCAPGG
jgi:hypothetical protein